MEFVAIPRIGGTLSSTPLREPQGAMERLEGSGVLNHSVWVEAAVAQRNMAL